MTKLFLIKEDILIMLPTTRYRSNKVISLQFLKAIQFFIDKYRLKCVYNILKRLILLSKIKASGFKFYRAVINLV